jgi:PAS domain S-box-containing protein
MISSLLHWNTHSDTEKVSGQIPLTSSQLLIELVKSIGIKVQKKLGKVQIPNNLQPGENTQENYLIYIQNTYNFLLQSLGSDLAKSSFESEIINFRNKYGANNAYFELIKMLPIPVMETEKLALMNRSELEAELRANIKDLENIKINLEKIVEQRTEVISSERNKLSLILSGIVDSVIAVDKEKKVILFNKAAENLTGHKKEAVLGKPISEIIKIFEDINELSSDVYSPIRPNNFEGIIYSKKNLKLLGSNNKQTYINLLVGQITESSEINLGCILTLHDVSKEQELDQMKFDFVAMAAHELRTPLTSIKDYLYVFMRDYKNTLNSDQTNILSKIDISTQRLGSLVENLLNVSRIEQGKMTVNIQPLDWSKTIDENIAEIIGQAKEKKIQINFEKPPEAIFVQADKARISEVLTNLIANSIKYTPGEGAITIWIEKSGNDVVTHVKDTGSGIPKESIPNLFTKFYRVSGPLGQGVKGTGLGLYISKSIIDMHKGKIWVESEVGKGSVFSFSIPSANAVNSIGNN